MQEAPFKSSSIVSDLSARIYLCSNLIALSSLISEEADEFIAEGVKAKQDKKNIRKQLMDQAREIVSNKTLFSHCYSAQRTVANADVVPDALPIERELHEAISQSDHGSKWCDSQYLINELSGQAIRNAYATKKDDDGRKPLQKITTASRVKDHNSGSRVEEWARVAHAIDDWVTLKERLTRIKEQQENNDRSENILGFFKGRLDGIRESIATARKEIEGDENFKNRKTHQKAEKVAHDLGQIEKFEFLDLEDFIKSEEEKNRTNIQLKPQGKSKLGSLITRIDAEIKRQYLSGWPPAIAYFIGRSKLCSLVEIRKKCAFFSQDGSFSDDSRTDDLEARLMFAENLYHCVRDSLDGDKKREIFEDSLNRLFIPYGGKVRFSWQWSQQDSERARVEEVDPGERDECVDCVIEYLNKQVQPVLIQKGHFRRRPSVPAIFYPLHDLKEALEAYGSADPSIVTQIEKLNQRLMKFGTFEAYWQTEGDQDLVWRVMAAVTTFKLAHGHAINASHSDNRADERLLAAVTAASRVYDALVDAGFHWHAMDREDVAENRQLNVPVWSLVVCPTPKGQLETFLPQAALQQSVCLKYHDQKILGTHKWFVVSENVLTKSKLLKWLAVLDSQREKIQHVADDWPGWQIWDDAIVAHDLGEPDLGERNKIAFDLFTASYREAVSNNNYHFKKMAATLHKCLVDLGVSLWPSLKEGDSLLPAFATLKQSDVLGHSVEVSWKEDAAPRGSILEIKQFGIGIYGHKPKVVASLGGEFSMHVLRWMNMFELFEAQKDCRGMLVLDSIKTRVMALPLDLEAEITILEMQKEIDAWLGTHEGMKELNAALQFARENPESPQSQFWRQLLSDLRRMVGTKVIPSLAWGAGQLQVEWPAGIEPVESVQWVFDSVVPSRHALDKPIQFSTDPKKAAGVFSLGPESEESPIYIADRLREIATEAKLDVAIKISSKIRAASIKEPDLSDIPSPENLSEFLSWLCTEADPMLNDAIKDEVLTICRQWANCYGAQITPVDYSFQSPNIPGEISDDLDVVFAPNSDVGDALIASFGITGSGSEVVQSPVYAVSAGPPPQGYGDLVEFIESDDDLRDTSLRDLIRRWPSKRLKSARSLQNAIKGEFFDLFFETMDSLSDDNLRSHAQSAFADILKSELSAFLFMPSTISEVEDDWIKPVNKSTEMSGGIKKVVKPGLRDSRGALITPAIVELE